MRFFLQSPWIEKILTLMIKIALQKKKKKKEKDVFATSQTLNGH